MVSKQVLDVDVIIDRSTTVFSNISDAYLKKALIRNKEKSGIQSIIQTIQKKQDDIRSLPLSKSFIVQGCAGSGKTMILLHRLRYLLYNKIIDSEKYLFLVPSFYFKKFIADIAKEFKIGDNNIVPFQLYYQSILGKREVSDSDASELVFNNLYLSRVYSTEFIRECYRSIFELINKQTAEMIDYYDGKLNEIVKVEEKNIDSILQNVTSNSVKSVCKTIMPIQDYLSIKVTSFDDISLLLNEIVSLYEENKKIIDLSSKSYMETTISPSDPRIIDNERLAQIQSDILQETENLNKATVFTRWRHSNKLKKLSQKYDATYTIVEKEIIEKERDECFKRIAAASVMFGNFTIEEIAHIIKVISEVLTAAQEEIKKYENRNRYIEIKYNNEIACLNRITAMSPNIHEHSNKDISTLETISDFFVALFDAGKKLIDSFKDKISKAELNDVNEKFKLFNRTSTADFRSYLNTIMFNECKRKLNDEFGIKICSKYKHYWYIQLYCHYLTGRTLNKTIPYIFIDETQDLSVSEIVLIYKINTNFGKNETAMICRTPIMNMFGDVNQTVTEHGISKWEQLKYCGIYSFEEICDKIFFLTENFRNPNQIIDFCNYNLPFNMKKIGVDMERVSEYPNLQELIKRNNRIYNGAVFIVKDEYARLDLIQLLSFYPFASIRNYEIYTVKESKGLEFTEIIVFDRGMTDNEKYISYTRALVKLNVVYELLKTTDHTQNLIEQGEEPSEP